MFTHFLPVSEHCFVNVTFIDRLSLLKLTMKDGKSFNVSPLELSRLKKALQKKTT